MSCMQTRDPDPVLRVVQFHALVLSAFASLIAPFGGFFASGFKRGFKIKDFGDSIPGHGGMTDRMDCQARVSHGLCGGLGRQTRVHGWLAAQRPAELIGALQLPSHWARRAQSAVLVARIGDADDGDYHRVYEECTRLHYYAETSVLNSLWNRWSWLCSRTCT